jgi:hypothetical protein
MITLQRERERKYDCNVLDKKKLKYECNAKCEIILIRKEKQIE